MEHHVVDNCDWLLKSITCIKRWMQTASQKLRNFHYVPLVERVICQAGLMLQADSSTQVTKNLQPCLLTF